MAVATPERLALASTAHPHRAGSAYFYDRYGCRCGECSSAKMEKRNRARAVARAENRPSYQRGLEEARRPKHNQRGTCEKCGTETRYNGHTTKGPSRLCHPCACRELGARKVGTGPFQARLYAALNDGVSRFTDLYRYLDVTPKGLSARLDRELKGGRIVRVSRGRYALPGRP